MRCEAPSALEIEVVADQDISRIPGNGKSITCTLLTPRKATTRVVFTHVEIDADFLQGQMKGLNGIETGSEA